MAEDGSPLEASILEARVTQNQIGKISLMPCFAARSKDQFFNQALKQGPYHERDQEA